MASTLDETSKLTDRYQTTVPAGVRKHLRLKKGDRIRYVEAPDGRVFIEADPAGGDPALSGFLDLLESDLRARPDRVEAFSEGLRARLEALTEGVDVDLDEALPPDEE